MKYTNIYFQSEEGNR